MSDLLLDLARRPAARRALSRLPLPLPVPEPLRRASGPWSGKPLSGRRFILSADGELEEPLRAALLGLGAERLHGLDRAGTPDGHARRPRAARGERRREPLGSVHGLVFDATILDGPSSLGALHAFFHPLVRKLERHGRVLVVARPRELAADEGASATRVALEGFVRSLAKELGRRAGTAQLLEVAPGAEEELGYALRYLLSERSAFVTGQRLTLSEPLSGGAASYRGQRVLVTGAARGIGLAIARRLAEEGASLFLLDRPAERTALSARAGELGGRMLLVDLLETDAAAQLVTQLSQPVDAVIHNAGVTRDRTLGRMERASFEAAIRVNLLAPLELTRALVEARRLGEGGRVVYMSSVAGIAGNVGQTNYAASKAGLIGLVRAQSVELGERGVTVNALAPGFIETQMTAAMPWAIRQAARRLSALGQGGQPVDVAEAAVFFASPEARALNGQVLRVCGGALVGA